MKTNLSAILAVTMATTLAAGGRSTADTHIPCPGGGFDNGYVVICGRGTGSPMTPPRLTPLDQRYEVLISRVVNAPQCAGSGIINPVLIIEKVWDTTIAETVAVTERCVPLEPTPPVEPTPGVPAIPPEEIWKRVPLPVPTVNVDPRVRGLVGLDTHVWYDQPTTATVQLTIGPWTGRVDAHITHYEWDMGDGTRLRSPHPGTPAWPAATHVYRQSCACTITARTHWTGTFTTRLTGLGPVTLDIGTHTVDNTRPYDVWEAQAVIIPTDRD